MLNKLLVNILLRVVVRKIASRYVDALEQKELFDLRKQLLSHEYQELLSEDIQIKLKRISLDCYMTIEDYKEKLQKIVTEDLKLPEELFRKSIEREKAKRKQLREEGESLTIP